MSPKVQSQPETKGLIRKRCCIQRRLDGKIALVTEAHTGLGFVTTCELARRGARVIMACRSVREAEDARKLILLRWGPNESRVASPTSRNGDFDSFMSPISTDQLWIEYVHIGSLDNIRDFVQRFSLTHSKLDMLIHTMNKWKPKYSVTQDNLERTIGLNYLGPFLLTELLLPLLKRATQARVIFVSSRLHFWACLNKPDLQLGAKSFGSFRAYCQSKLALLTYATQLGQRLKSTKVIVASVDPGLVRDDLKTRAKVKSKWEVQRPNEFKSHFEVEMADSNQPTSEKPKTRKGCFHSCKLNFVSILRHLLTALLWPFLVSPWQAVQTVLFASLSPTIVSGGYYANCSPKNPAVSVGDEKNQKWLRQKSCELVHLAMENEDAKELSTGLDLQN